MAKGKEETKNVPAPAPQGGAVVPDFMKGADHGMDNISNEDVELPRIKLMQLISSEVEQGLAKPGEFWHTVTEEPLGSTLTITPLFVFVSYLLWRPRKDGGGILARSPDGVHWNPPNATFEVKLEGKKAVQWRTAKTVAQSGLADWGSSDPEDPQSQPAATKMIQVVSHIHEFPSVSPVVITLQRAAFKVGKKLLGKLKMSQVPIYGLRMVMSSEKDSGPSGDFMNYVFRQDGFVTDAEQFKHFAEQNEHFRSTGVKIKEDDDLQNEGGEAEEALDKAASKF